MPFDGSGNYVLPSAPDFPAVSGQPITATYYNSVMNDLATALSQTLLRDGSVKLTGDLNLNGKSLLNILNATLTGLLLTAASTASSAGVRLPQGTAPASPSNGDVWTTSTGIYARIQGVTYRLLGAPTVLQTVATTSGTAATFSGLSLNYSRLIFAFSGVSHSNVSAQNLQIQVSADGVSWSTAAALLNTVVNTTFVQGNVEFDLYTLTQTTLTSALVPTVTAVPTSPSAFLISAPVAALVNVTGGMDYVRFVWSGGATYDAGSITCYAV